MKTTSRWVALTLGILMLLMLPETGHAEDPADYQAARDIVGRVQEHLRDAAKFAREGLGKVDDGKDFERYANAQKALSEFDRDLSRGKYNKGKLDSSIEHLKNLVEKNTLATDHRDRLTEDLHALRDLRSRKGRA